MLVSLPSEGWEWREELEDTASGGTLFVLECSALGVSSFLMGFSVNSVAPAAASVSSLFPSISASRTEVVGDGLDTTSSPDFVSSPDLVKSPNIKNWSLEKLELPM